MNPTFTETDYRRLLMLVCLGEWMVNAVVKEPDPVYEDIASKAYGFAAGTALESLVRFDKNLGGWVPSEAFAHEAHALIDHYDDKTFWEELTTRLAERDLGDAHGERGLSAMRPQQKLRQASTIAKAYTKEFEEHGLERFCIDDPGSK